MWDPETGGGFDGLHARRRQPQPGRGVDPRGDIDLATRTAFLACPAMTSVRAGIVTRSPQRVAADPSRVITRLFVPGQEAFEHQESRAGAVLSRILALTDDDVELALDDVLTRFDWASPRPGRHVPPPRQRARRSP